MRISRHVDVSRIVFHVAFVAMAGKKTIWLHTGGDMIMMFCNCTANTGWAAGCLVKKMSENAQ